MLMSTPGTMAFKAGRVHRAWLRLTQHGVFRYLQLFTPKQFRSEVMGVRILSAVACTPS